MKKILGIDYGKSKIGLAIADGPLATPWKVVKYKDIKIHTENNTKQLPIPHKHAIKTDEDERVGVLKKLTSRFISSIINKNELTPSFEEGLRVQKLIEEIRAANNRYD